MLMIDKLSTVPVYEQIINGIETNILLGLYPPESALPSLRELSVTLGINPNTIQKSYAELTRRGVICPSPGSGCYVSPQASELIRQRAMEKLRDIQGLCAELRLAGVPLSAVMDTVRTSYEDPVSHEDTNTFSQGGKQS